jgi:hypothetical protein
MPPKLLPKGSLEQIQSWWWRKTSPETEKKPRLGGQLAGGCGWGKK